MAVAVAGYVRPDRGWTQIRTEPATSAQATVPKNEYRTEPVNAVEARTIGLRTMTLSSAAMAEVRQIRSMPAPPVARPTTLPPLDATAPRRPR